MTIPVVLIHWGNLKGDRYDLDLVTAHASNYQRVPSTVYLLSDSYSAEVRIEDYWTRAAKFEDHYVHMSGNHVAFEKRCIQRWYVLSEWMHRRHVPTVLYIDSDILLYADATAAFAPYRDCALTLALGSSAASSYFTLDGLDAFLDYVDSIYIGRNDTFHEFERIYREMQAQGLPGGISDMACFKFFKEQVRHVKVGEMTEIHDGATWDHNINSGDSYRMKGGIKALEFRRGLPYGERVDAPGERVRFNALHFQGSAKRLLPRFGLQDGDA